MAKMFNIKKVIRINGRVVKIENMGYGDEAATKKEAERIARELASNGYTLKLSHDENRLIATNYVNADSAIKVFVDVVDMTAGIKYAVKKSVNKNGQRLESKVTVFEGSQDECTEFVKAELERYKGLDVIDMFTTEAGSGHVEYETKKGSNFKVNFIVKAAV